MILIGNWNAKVFSSLKVRNSIIIGNIYSYKYSGGKKIISSDLTVPSAR